MKPETLRVVREALKEAHDDHQISGICKCPICNALRAMDADNQVQDNRVEDVRLGAEAAFAIMEANAAIAESRDFNVDKVRADAEQIALHFNFNKNL